MSQDASPPDAETEAIVGATPDAPQPKHNQRIRQRIADKLHEKGATGSPHLRLVCALCGQRDFTIGSYVPLGLSLTPQLNSLFPGKAYPCVTVICRICGNTYLMNLGVLGFKEEDWAGLTFLESDDAD